MTTICSLMLEKAKNNKTKLLSLTPYFLFGFYVLLATFCPAIAADGTVNQVVEKLINFIGKLFQVVGIILLAYSVGQLVLAFKNEDADSKTRATTQLVVAAALLALPAMLEALGLTSMIPDLGGK